MKILGITQARVGSSRLPGKVLLKVGGKTFLDIHLERLKKSKKLDKIIVATTLEEEAAKICSIAELNGVAFYQGSLDNVLDRFYQAALLEKPDIVVRVTSDCPLLDWKIVDSVIEFFQEEKTDYASNTLNPSFPDGIDVEVFSFRALEKAWREATLKSDLEHVTPYIWRNSTYKNQNLFSSRSYQLNENYSKYRLTLDEPQDLKILTKLIEEVGENDDWKSYINYLNNNTELLEINSHIIRNEGYMKSVSKEKQLLDESNFTKSIEYRNKIHDLIPGGAHTYSKGDDQFPHIAPAAIKKGQGAYVWDLDDNKFLDCSMGLTSVSLGHAYPEVVERVKAELANGVNFQRPSYLEMEMAEKFLSLVPGHEMIKFAKNGSIVTTAAVKLARAYTGRKLIAFPYDHPFYSYDDWFIGKTACNFGIPDEVSNLSVTYKADDLNSLKELFEKYPNQIACVISEPEKNYGIPENYLQQAIDIAHKYGAIYIVDEMITGFKTDFPGSITKYKVTPDLTTWGKGIANGFSFCALTGKKEIMELGGIRNTGKEKLFLISTTHGGETHTIAAGLATIDVFEEKNVIQHNHAIGKQLNKLTASAISKLGLSDNVKVAPSYWMPMFTFNGQTGEASPGLRTLFMQEMIKRGILFQGIFVPCFSHTLEDVDFFAEAFESSLEVYKKGLEDGFEKYLIGSPAKPVFRKFL